ncbi:hypothetical protein M9434_002658 [Picochlorum sp. BPE23]|nr:hypothetical protein M9434_002658 [Picochlorum sp. BPE23]
MARSEGLGKILTFSSPSYGLKASGVRAVQSSMVHRTPQEATMDVLEWFELCKYVSGFAQTSLGQRACLEDMTPPTTEQESLKKINETQAVTLLQEEYLLDIDFGGIQTLESRECLQRVKRGGMLHGEGLLAIASLVRGAFRVQKKIREAVYLAEEQDEGERISFISREFLDVSSDVPSGIASAILAKIDESGSVKEGSSDDVRKASGRVRTLEKRLKGILNKYGEDIEEHKGRLCVVSGKGRDPPKGCVMVGSKFGGSAWIIEPEAAVNINNDLVQAKEELRIAEESVLWSLTDQVSMVDSVLEQYLSSVVWLDTIYARYRFGNWISGSLVTKFSSFKRTGKPRRMKVALKNQVEDDSKFLLLRKLRHPLLMAKYLLEKEASASETTGVATASGEGSRKRLPGWRRPSSGHQSMECSDTGMVTYSGPVPVDVFARQRTKGVIITGPNTGDIGDEQSLSSNLSTFSGHLKRIENIRKESTGKSLVLLDELGTGTDAIDGAALGLAVMDALSRDKPGGSCITFATTHHSALTSLKYSKPGVFENVSVEFDEVNLEPTYKLLWGVPGRSCALYIAENVHLGHEIVHNARALLGTDAHEVNDSLAFLESLRKEEDNITDKISQIRSKRQRSQGMLQYSRYKVTISVIVVLLALKIWGNGGSTQTSKFGEEEPWKAQAPTLVIYVFSDSDPEYERNLSYFVKEGIKENDNCDYIIVIQVSDMEDDVPDVLKSVNKRNLRVMKHENKCFDIGTVGWVFSVLEVSDSAYLDSYSYYIWLNSSVRGPFLPSYLNNKYHWSRAFTEKLSDRVKLVGPTICCGQSGDHLPALHVQSYAVATDSVGLNVLRSNNTIFNCYDEMEDVVFHSEQGMSEAILNAGYSMDSLMSRYQGIDWQGSRELLNEFGCNGDLNPLQPGFYDGTDIDPMEVMFVKVKKAFLESEWPSAVRAERLSLWKDEATSDNITEHILMASQNLWLDTKVDRMLADAHRRNMSCFDWEYYLDANKQDLSEIWDEEDPEAEAWDQFIHMGIYEGRPHRWRDECIS